MHDTDIRAQLEEERRIIDAATDGPWEIQQGAPTMSGVTWTLRSKGQPGIRIGAHEYQHGTGNSDFIAHARTALPLRNAQIEAVLDALKAFEHAASLDNDISLAIRLTTAEIRRAIEEAGK